MKISKRVFQILAFLYTAVVLVLGFSVNTLFFILLAAIVFFRPISREAGVLQDLDEREMAYSYRSSHLSFYLVLASIIVYIILNSLILQKEVATEWFLILMIAIFGKVLASIYLSPEKRKVGLYVGFFFGVAWLLFTLFSHGISFVSLMESSVGGGIILATLIAWRWPKIGGSILVIGGLFVAFFFVPRWPSLMMKITMFIMLPFPILLAGILNLIPQKREEEPQQLE